MKLCTLYDLTNSSFSRSNSLFALTHSLEKCFELDAGDKRCCKPILRSSAKQIQFGSGVVRAQIRLTKEKKPWNVNDISGDREPPMTIFGDTMESLIVNLTFDPHTQKLLAFFGQESHIAPGPSLIYCTRNCSTTKIFCYSRWARDKLRWGSLTAVRLHCLVLLTLNGVKTPAVMRLEINEINYSFFPPLFFVLIPEIH